MMQPAPKKPLSHIIALSENPGEGAKVIVNYIDALNTHINFLHQVNHNLLETCREHEAKAFNLTGLIKDTLHVVYRDLPSTITNKHAHHLSPMAANPLSLQHITLDDCLVNLHTAVTLKHTNKNLPSASTIGNEVIKLQNTATHELYTAEDVIRILKNLQTADSAHK